MWLKFYLLLFISALSTLTLGEAGLYAEASRHVRSVGQISAKKCEEYSKIVQNNKCTHFTPEDAWWYIARPGEFPHLALLKGNKNDTIFCPGSLISEKFVLTNARCVRTLEETFEGGFWAWIGDTDLIPKNSHAFRLKVIKSYVHPEFNQSGSSNDIALVELERNVQFDQMKRPACLNTEHEIVEPILIAGWGNSSHSYYGKDWQLSSKLLKSMLELCNEGDSSTFMKAELKSYLHFCTGESGSPVMTNINNSPCMYKIVGVAAFGADCLVGCKNAIIEVSKYISWIESIVWPGEH